MQLSLRSQMIAGVAAFGATAIAITPIAQPDLMPNTQQVYAAVQLTQFANPVTALLDTIAFASEDIFYQAALPGADELFWPDSFYTDDFSFVYAPGYIGLLPDAVNQFSFGALSAVLNNLSGYIDTTIYGTTGLAGSVATAVFNTPFALIAAAQLAVAGQIDAAIAELQAQILEPLQGGVALALQSIGYLLDNSISNVSTLITDTVPRLLTGLIDQAVGAGEYLLQSVIATATAIVTSLSSLDIEGAWNAAVNGLLGPDGVLGAVESLTVGIGIVQDVDYEQEGIVPTVTYPSVRSVLTSVSQRLGDFSANGDGGILNDPFAPVFQASPAAATPDPGSETAVQAPVIETSPVIETGPVADITAVDITAVKAPAVETTPAVEVSGGVNVATGSGDAPTRATVDVVPSADTGSDAESAAAPAREPVSRASDRAAKSVDRAAKSVERAAKSSARAAKAAAGA